MLQALLEKAGYDPQSYSGKGMGNKYCLGVYISPNKSFRSLIADVIVALANVDKNTHIKVGDMFCGMQTDTLGKGTIVYFPGIEFEDNDEEDQPWDATKGR